MLGVNYGPDENPLDGLKDRDRGLISVYARGDDYHELVKPRLKAIGRWLAEETGCELEGLRRYRAADGEAAGGGRRPRLAGQAHQSRVAPVRLLAVPRRHHDDAGDPAGCPRDGSLRLLDRLPRHLPDGGLSAPLCARCAALHQLPDLIENKGPIPREFRKAMGNRIYGCDDCLAACPWNKFASESRQIKLAAREHLKRPALADLARLDDAAFRALFTKSPVKRVGRDRFLRNVLIAIGNSGDRALAAVAAELLDDASPLVRGAAVWALRELSPPHSLPAGPPAGENDPDVLAEWAEALA